MELRSGMELEVSVEKAVVGGRGLARVDGFVVFVERGLPGQKVLARIGRVKKGFAEAEAVRVVEETPEYAAPFCPHYGDCGGCTWQDMDYGAQLRWKREHVQESLRRIGGARSVSVAETVPSPETRRYRNKMEFAFVGNLHLGLHERANPKRILDVGQCGLVSDLCVDILNETRAWCGETGVQACNPRLGVGLWRWLVLRQGVNTGQTMAHLITGPMRGNEALPYALGEHLTAKFESLTTFVHSVRTAKSSYAVGEKVESVIGPGVIEERIGDVDFRVSPNSFLQTNTLGAEKLYETVARAGEFTQEDLVWDLYCGSGGVALSIADKARRVVGVESSRSAVRDARFSMRQNGVENCEFIHGDVKESLERPGPAPDVVVLDPPRGGVHPDTAAALTALAPDRIVYVSCNPATLARDVAGLLDAYDIASAAPVDMFPHTPHIECVLGMKRKG